MEKDRVLILCTGNAARSQMAEAWLKKYAGDRFEVYSAGYDPRGIHPSTRKVMEEAGLALNDQYSKGVKDFLGKMIFQYLIIVCAKAEQHCPTTFPGIVQRLYWPFEDPVTFTGSEEEKLAKFREVRDKIEARLKLWLRELL
ncbi:MAG: arsenate reductase ArsC [Thermodesulfobacteriota bacterium]